MTVVAAGELENPVPVGRGSREPQRRHCRFGAGRDEAHHLDRGNRVDDLGRQLHLGLRRGTERRSVLRRLDDCRDRLRVGVAEDQRAPRHHPIDIPAPVHALDLRARPPAHEDRLVEADGAHRANGRVDAARDQLERPPVQSRAVALQSHAARSFVQYETIMSAPARLIAVSDSSAACRSSSQPSRGGGLDHRVLARDVVGGDGKVEALAGGADHVEVRQRRLDHDHVGAFGDVLLALAQRFADVRGVHLVAAPVAERRRRVGRLAERAVEGRRVLRRVRDDRRVRQRLADRAHAPVHHVARADGVGAGVDVADRGPGEELEGRVVVHLAGLRDHAAVAV